MWVTSTIGFFSAVQKTGTDYITVRSRARADLDRLREKFLAELGEVLANVGTDYPYRATCSHEQWAEAMRSMAMELDYSNFKSAVANHMGSKRANIYHDVWAALWKIQQEESQENNAHAAKSPRSSSSNRRQKSKRTSCGGVLVGYDGCVLLRRVRGDFGGARWTFAKGRPNPGESKQEAALREVKEETGMQAEIRAPIPGTFEGTTTINHYWLMRQVGEAGEPDQETAEVRWCEPDVARALIVENPSGTVRKRDLAVLEAALVLAAEGDGQ